MELIALRFPDERRHTMKWFAPVLAALLAALLLVPCLAQADIPEIMSYQGVLRDGSGNPVPDGSYNVTFRIYDVAAGGTALWSEGQPLAAMGGIISAHLGSVTTLTTLDFDVPYWLGISVENGAELVPRTAFTTVPYAVHAGFTDTWGVSGDDAYHDVGNVGIGLSTPERRLDLLAGDEPGARFRNASSQQRFAVEGRNLGGTGGGFLAGVSGTWYPAIPSAIFAYAAPGYRGAHVSAQDEAGLWAHSVDNTAVYGWSTNAYAGHFMGGLGVKVDGKMRSDELQVVNGAVAGYVLTSDSSGVATWQPGGGGSDSDWTIAGSDMYSGVTGRVGIGLSAPTAKLEIYNDTTDEALEVKHGGAFVGRVVSIERTSVANTGNDLLQLKVPGGSAYDSQFIEAENGGTNVFAVDGDGYVKAVGGGEFGGAVSVTGSDERQVEVTSTALTDETKVLSGISTASGTGFDPRGVYGESIPADDYGIGGEFVGGWRGVIGTVYPNGTAHYRGVHGAAVGAAGSHIGTNYGVYGHATGGATNYGVYGRATDGVVDYAGYFSGDVNVTGTLYGGVPAFKIDHPLDPENRYLVHSCVESDEMMNIYNGNVTLDARGEASVEMPEWFEALNQDFRYQLTCIGGFAPVYVAETIAGNRFMIAGGEPGMVVSWQVTGVRHDPLAEASRVVAEQDKPANEVGKYMHPEAYGMPLTAGVDYHEERELPARKSLTERRPLRAFDPNDGE
jgi:hypothetical protein